MFNKTTKKVKHLPSKEDRNKLIGTEINDMVVTNVEKGSWQVRVIKDQRKHPIAEGDPEEWVKRHNMSGLQFHPGELLTQHESAELLELADEKGIINYNSDINQ